MKTRITLAFLLLLRVGASAQEMTDFRSVNWKMSRAEVKKAETEELFHEDKDSLGYRSEFLDKLVYIFYYFKQNRLQRAIYNFQLDYVDKNLYIPDYYTLRQHVRQQYGKPLKERMVWKNPLFKHDQKEWGLAISVGHLSYQSFWRAGRSLVAVLLHGQEHQVFLNLEYYDSDLADEVLKKI